MIYRTASLHSKPARRTIGLPIRKLSSRQKLAPMSSSGSVTAWFDQLRTGDHDAAQQLCQRYFQRLVDLARKKLRGAPRGMADEEDVALSAFDSFCRGAEQGRFPQLHDRDDLWHLLLVITERKAIDLVKYEKSQKRGKGLVRHEGSMAGDSSGTSAFGQLPAPEPTPALVAQFVDECRRLLDALVDETLRAVALAKMESYTNKEIAERLNCSVPTIERKLRRVRQIWRKETAR
jgi:DNA-directed RNA polymerase specialized sigma24 family protein